MVLGKYLIKSIQKMVEDSIVLEKEIKPHGTGARVLVPKKYLDRKTAIILIPKKKEDQKEK